MVLVPAARIRMHQRITMRRIVHIFFRRIATHFTAITAIIAMSKKCNHAHQTTAHE